VEYGEMLGLAAVFQSYYGLPQDSAAELTKAIEREPHNHLYYHALAPLLVESGDLEGYRRLRARIIAQFGQTTDANTAERMAKDCLILPLSAPDLDTVAKMADCAVTAAQDSSFLPSFQFAKGFAEYRQGRFSSAADWMQKVLEASDPSFYRAAQANLVLAMAQHQLGQTNSALAALAAGSQIINTNGPTGGGGDWIIARTLRSEAEKLMQADQSELAAKPKH